MLRSCVRRGVSGRSTSSRCEACARLRLNFSVPWRVPTHQTSSLCSVDCAVAQDVGGTDMHAYNARRAHEPPVCAILTAMRYTEPSQRQDIISGMHM
jgi:hypothetical protein